MHEINVHNEGKSERVACKCGVTFLTEKRLEFHKKTSCCLNEKVVEVFREKRLEILRPIKIKHLKCDQCEKVFSNNSDIKRHIQEKHEGFCEKCKFCGKEFAHRNLRKHILAVHEKASKECEICFKSFSIYTIKLHKRNIHNI